jgi:NADH-quinone oxidoreductase subunit H
VDPLIFRLAPAITFVSAFMLLAALPVASGRALADLNVGLLYIIAASTLGVYGVVLGGLAQGNKWGLLGGFRAGAQLVSYEVPLALSLPAVGVYSGSLRLIDVVEHQQGLWHVVPLFIPFVVYVIASIAELKATPFDLPEAESELVAGYNTEYSGMSFAFFFLAEFVELFILPAFVVIFFFGGWHGPLFGIPESSFFGLALQSLYFLIKTAVWVWIYLWIRATLPRYRDDQLMNLAWKGLIPLALLGLVLAAFLRMFVEVL